MADYLSPATSAYIYDDQGQKGLKNATQFVIAGDFNAADEGDKHRPGVIEQLLQHDLVNAANAPTSDGGKQHSDANYSSRFTAHCGSSSRLRITVQTRPQNCRQWRILANPIRSIVSLG